MRGITIARMAAVAALITAALAGCATQTGAGGAAGAAGSAGPTGGTGALHGTTVTGATAGAAAITRTMSRADERAADRFEATMDAGYPKKSPLLSDSGELQHGDSGGVPSTGTGLAPGDYVMTLACTGTTSLTFALAFPGQPASTYDVTCGKPLTVAVTTTKPGGVGFSVSAPSASHPNAYYFAGFALR